MTSYVGLIDGKAGAYGVYFPDLPGCVAMGATIDKAIANAADALRDWVEATEKKGGQIPAPRARESLAEDPDAAEMLSEGALVVRIPLVRETGRPVKANLSLDAGVLAAIDEEAKRRRLTRSAFIELMARHALPDMAL